MTCLRQRVRRTTRLNIYAAGVDQQLIATFHGTEYSEENEQINCRLCCRVYSTASCGVAAGIMSNHETGSQAMHSGSSFRVLVQHDTPVVFLLL